MPCCHDTAVTACRNVGLLSAHMVGQTTAMPCYHDFAVTTCRKVGVISSHMVRQQQATAAHRNEGVQEVEGLVDGGVSVNVALGDELVMDDGL